MGGQGGQPCPGGYRERFHGATKHPMSSEHFIVRHTLVLADGTTVGAKTFTPADKPESSYELPAGYKGKITATSFCNQHDFWLSEMTV